MKTAGAGFYFIAFDINRDSLKMAGEKWDRLSSRPYGAHPAPGILALRDGFKNRS